MGFMQDNAGGGGPPLIKWNGMEGRFVRHGSDEAFNDETFVVDAAGAVAGYVKFNGKGEKPERRVGAIFPNDEAPARASLGDTDRSKWAKGRFSDEPEDPWTPVIELPLKHVATGEDYVLTCQSKTAIGAASDLLSRLRKLNGQSDPVIKLAVGKMNTKFGPRKKPVFVLVGKNSARGEGDGGKAPFNDSIGF